MFRRVVKPTVIGASSALSLGVFSLYADAPMADMGDGKYVHHRETKFPEWVHNCGRVPLFLGVTAMGKFFLQFLNSFDVEGSEILLKSVEERPRGVPLITVSNHSATVDDPAVLSAQEYSYTNGKTISALFFGAKTLPVKRGAGVDHVMMESIFEKVENGEWVHIFPEGKICQYELLGGRDPPRRDEIGRLKWGVGKLIARSKVRPVVVPFYHFNMEKVMPQNEKNQLITIVPKTGIDLRVRVGEPLSFDDLLDAFENDRVVGATPWETQEREKALYQAITKRIEDALLELAEPFMPQQ